MAAAAAEEEAARLVSFVGGGGGSSLAHAGFSLAHRAGPLLRVVGTAQPGRGAPTLLLFPRDAACVVTAFAASPSGALLAVAEARAAADGAARLSFHSLAAAGGAAAGELSAAWLDDVDVGDIAVSCMEFR